MSQLKIWGWNKKPRTMLRYIRPGDLFCLRLDEGKYAFGRIVSKIFGGHVAEFFDFFSPAPDAAISSLGGAKATLSPTLIDAYSLFDKKVEEGSDWRIIGCQENYVPVDLDDVYFVYGLEGLCKKIDIFDRETAASVFDQMKYPRLSPLGDHDVRQLLRSRRLLPIGA